MQASRVDSLSNVNSCWKRWISLTEEIHSLSNSLIVVDSLSVDRSISSISTKFRTNSFFSSRDLWSFRLICLRFLYNINSVLYKFYSSSIQFQDYRSRYWNWIDKDYIIYLVQLVYCYRYICDKLFILSNALLWITFHLDYAYPMFPYRVRMLFCCIFIYAMALFHDKAGVGIVKCIGMLNVFRFHFTKRARLSNFVIK